MQMARGLASFRKYIPADLVRTLVAQGIEAKPGGTRRELTIMFTDLAGFTSLSERLMEGIVPVLSRYLEDTSARRRRPSRDDRQVHRRAVMAFWGAPTAKRARRRCLRRGARRGAQARRRRRRAQHARRHQYRHGAGRQYRLLGPAELYGDRRSGERRRRLEPVNKRYGTQILIGAATREAAGDAIVVRRLDRIAVYGRAEGTVIYELLGIDGDATPEWVRPYEAGLDAYEQRRWSEAIGLFEETIELKGTDQPAEIMIARCRDLIANPPPADWQPVVALHEK